MRCVCNIDGRGEGTLCAAHQNGVDAAVRAEREACAKIADDQIMNDPNDQCDVVAAKIAAQIRARNKL